MCSRCKDILKGFLIKHQEHQCPIAASEYCSHCAIYGHMANSCKSLPPQWATQPCYKEHFMTTDELNTHGINKRTPILHITSPQNDNYLKIKNDEKSIKSFLLSISIQPGSKATNRAKLQSYANRIGKRLVFIS